MQCKLPAETNSDFTGRDYTRENNADTYHAIQR